MRSPPFGSQFRRLRLATAVGAMGDGFMAVALPLLAAGITRDPLPVAGVLAVQRLPWVILALLGRGLGQVDRRTLMGTVGTLRAMAVGVVGLAELGLIGTALHGGDMVGQQATLGLIYAAALVLGAAEAVVDESAHEAVVDVVDPPQTSAAAGRLEATGLVAILIGLVVGGVLFSVAPALPFLLDTLLFSVASLLTLLLSGSGRTAHREPEIGARPARPATSRTLPHRTNLLALGVVTALTNLAAGAVLGVLVLFALEVLDLDALGFSILLTAVAAGTLAGGLLAPDLGRLLRAGPALVGSLVVSAAGYGLAAWGSDPVVAGAGLVLAGLSAMAATIVGSAVRHALLRRDTLETVTRRFRVVAWAAIPIGAVVGGSVAELTSLRGPMLVAAGATLLAAVAAIPATRQPLSVDA